MATESAIDPADTFMQNLLISGPNDSSSRSEPSAIGENDWQPSDDEGSASGRPEERVDPQLAEHIGRPIPTWPFAEVCRQLKQRKNLSPESAAELDVFAKAHSAEEHFAMMFALNLETRDLLKSMRPEGSWDNIRTYATAFLLSPGVASYRGKVSNKLLEALRELNVALLPPEKEFAQVKQVLSCISKHLTTARNTIKTLLNQSVDEPEDKGMVAVLAQAVVGKTVVKPTVQLYMRLAFLRWHVLNYASLDGNKWWLKVDDNLMKRRKECTTEVALSAAFADIYNKDKTKFGDPAASGLKVVEVRELDGWQTLLQAHARSVEPANLKKRKQPPT